LSSSPGAGEIAKHEPLRRIAMKIWNKPSVKEQGVGLEVTSYLPAEIDVI